MDSALVIGALERAPEIIVNLVREVPPAVMKRRPFPTKWSAHEHACHLAFADRLYLSRLDQFLAEPQPIITPYDPGRNDPDGSLLQEDLDDSIRQYTQNRVLLIARLRKLTPDVWQRTAEHGEYSHYSVLIMFRHLAFHDFFHAYRIEELLLRKEWTAEWQAFASRP